MTIIQVLDEYANEPGEFVQVRKEFLQTAAAMIRSTTVLSKQGYLVPAQAPHAAEPVADLLDELERCCQGSEDSMHDTIAIDFVRQFVKDIRTAALAPPAPAAQPVTWQPISTAPKDSEVWFWLIPKTAEEAWLNTSGEPITAKGDGYMKVCRFNCWGSLYKATHWMPLPQAPQAPAAP